MVTAPYASKLLDLPIGSAMLALQELGEAGVLHKRNIGRTDAAHVAIDLFHVVTGQERELATPPGGTAPIRPAPAAVVLPDGSDRSPAMVSASTTPASGTDSVRNAGTTGRRRDDTRA